MELSIRTIALFRGLASWGGFFVFLCFEYLRPYRPSSVPKTERLLTNISLTILNSVVLSLLFATATINISLDVSANHIGILNNFNLPFWQRVFLAVIFMDFVFYFWHILNHRLPILWRFHRVHHSDLNMDVSTASRFHIGELALSSGIKIGLIYLIGANVASVILFESLLGLTAQFQHSSVKVPLWFEKFFWLFFVPPSMHRIHHSVVIPERNTNYGTILSIWDRILGTLRHDVPQEGIVIGLGSYRTPEGLGLLSLLLMPFTRSAR
ncbi:MAG: sterol desaturase family protein [Nitrospirae bacterium]|nr:sterol desaturase family protein [Nitrospirota bacterium]